MKHDSLDQGIKHYYQTQLLSEEKLDKLANLSETVNSRPAHLNRYRYAIAATFLLFTVSSVFLIHTQSGLHEQLNTRVAKEISLNHNKQLASEYSLTEFDGLNKVMDKLDFELKAPSRLISLGYRILGARYCSIQGQIAAQIKLENKQERTLTLYVTQRNKELASLSNQVQQSGSVTIQTWLEGDLFFGLADSIPVAPEI